MATVFQDTFTETTTTVLSSHAPDLGAGEWVQRPSTTGLINVVGDAGYAIGNSTSTSSTYYNETLIEGDVDVTLTFERISASNNLVGLILNNKTDLTAEHYKIYIRDGVDQFRAEKWVAGVVAATYADNTAITLAAGEHTMRVTVASGEIAVYFDGSPTAYITATDPSPLADGYLGVMSKPNGVISEVRAVDSGISDTTPPTLTSATATTTGSTTASGSATTDEGNGTLYAVATTSATAPTKAQVKAGQDHTGSAAVWDGSQSVSSTGSKSVSVTGLTAETTYYLHFMHEDAAENQSDVATSSSFTTTGAFASTISVSDPLKNNTGTVLASQTGIKVSVLAAADLESVYEAAATTNASGILSDITNAAIVAGSYHVAIKLTDGSVGITGAIEAV